MKHSLALLLPSILDCTVFQLAPFKESALLGIDPHSSFYIYEVLYNTVRLQFDHDVVKSDFNYELP